MQYKIRPSCYTGEWVVEVWEEEEGKGELNLVAFSGPSAEEWAAEYVVFKEGDVQQMPGFKNKPFPHPTVLWEIHRASRI